jgi:hypothetical protein
VVGGCGGRLGKAKVEAGGFGMQWRDGGEEEGFRDSWVIFGLGYGFGPGFGSVCSGDSVRGPVSGVFDMGETVGRLWA